MTVAAWDGRTLAADKLAQNNGSRMTVTKLFRVDDDRIAAVSGAFTYGLRVLDWLKSDGQHATFPTEKDQNASVLLVHRSGRIAIYENSSYPVVVEDPWVATGCGRDYARAALHMGFDAVRAVEVASALDVYCGNGIDTLRFEDTP